MKNNIQRFIDAQKEDYAIALKEIKNGHKESHWMWYIFPQIKGLGMSQMSQFYGLNGIEETKEYLENEYLKHNLLEICNALLSLKTSDGEEIFGYIDNIKLKSSMTLFNCADPKEEVFIKVLNKFFNGEKDDKTIKLINNY